MEALQQNHDKIKNDFNHTKGSEEIARRLHDQAVTNTSRSDKMFESERLHNVDLGKRLTKSEVDVANMKQEVEKLKGDHEKALAAKDAEIADLRTKAQEIRDSEEHYQRQWRSAKESRDMLLPILDRYQKETIPDLESKMKEAQSAATRADQTTIQSLQESNQAGVTSSAQINNLTLQKEVADKKANDLVLELITWKAEANNNSKEVQRFGQELLEEK